jgi:hypothetical protein
MGSQEHPVNRIGDFECDIATSSARPEMFLRDQERLPWVVGPSNAPAITGLPDAQANVELAVLSAIEHAKDPDSALAARIASADIDAERSRLYLDLILISLAPSARGDHELIWI